MWGSLFIIPFEKRCCSTSSPSTSRPFQVPHDPRFTPEVSKEIIPTHFTTFHAESLTPEERHQDPTKECVAGFTRLISCREKSSYARTSLHPDPVGIKPYNMSCSYSILMKTIVGT
ncbi:unnamed protein product [Allacma fusca]|uniref:Uncharacterized protein n=1 Tax=Allacma fusca TaxID=39272 RepID=A0A8J2K2V7_9HEXA|nr:unnamed protein product [Allacma fusca]